MKSISIDIETFSSVNLGKSGVYKYCQSDDFEILLFGYCVDNGEVKVVDLARGEKIPDEIIAALSDDSIIKWAFNAQFERVCLSKWLGMPIGEYLSPKSWKCSMVWSATLGLPLSLAGVGAVLGLEKQKLSEGKSLIRYFCIPCSPSKTNGDRIRNLPEHDVEKWEEFKEYNIRDVETELEIQKKLSKFPVPESEWEHYHLDQIINDRGIELDMEVVNQAILGDAEVKNANMARAQELTGLENPNSPMQLKEWLLTQGVETDSLAKAAVSQMLENADGIVKEVLMVRQQMSKSSVSKYTAMENVVCKDYRARGLIQFYGANRTGRYSGRLIQIQNLRRNSMSDLKEARALVKSGNFAALELLYDNIPDVLSQLIRTAFVPKKGHRFIVADFSAIEARVIAWLAKEQWRLDVFEGGGDIYCASAAQMFGVPVEKNGVNGHLRQKGKQAELACIAHGSLVLTDKGLVPIQDVLVAHKLWDGEDWVNHRGVIFKGNKEAITYEGLTATEDHLVWVKGESEPVRFEEAATNGAHLLQTGNGRQAIRMNDKSKRSSYGKEKDQVVTPSKVRVYDILDAGKNHRFTVSNVLVHNCGYGGSVGALKAMGAIEMGLAEEELKPLVDVWRRSNPNIVRLWWDVDRAVKTAIKERTTTSTHGIYFSYQSGMLFIKLPSGRSLAYVKPCIGTNKFGGESVNYEGVGGTKKWERIESYGPKFVENIIQAMSRDILSEAMIVLEQEGYEIVMHVHDEVVLEVPIGVSSVEEVCKMMSKTPSWAPGLLLDADGFECKFYQKD